MKWHDLTLPPINLYNAPVINGENKIMNILEICQANDLSVQQVEKALANLQEQGLVSGFVPGDMYADITLTLNAVMYLDLEVM